MYVSRRSPAGSVHRAVRIDRDCIALAVFSSVMHIDRKSAVENSIALLLVVGYSGIMQDLWQHECTTHPDD